MISIVTPWLDHPELIADYEAAVQGAQVVIVDNGSQEETTRLLFAMVARVGGFYVRNEVNLWFAAANNQGLKYATGEIVMFLNNDIRAGFGWLRDVQLHVQPGALYGPSAGSRLVGNARLPYIEGWCIAARQEVWQALNGWDAEAYPMPYWEDNDLCLRARLAGYKLVQTAWDVAHLSNVTSRSTPGAYAGSGPNMQTFIARVEDAQRSARIPA